MGWFRHTPSLLDLEVDRVTLDLQRLEPASEDYIRVLHLLEALRDVRDNRSPLDFEITRTTWALQNYEIGSDEYSRVLNTLEKLRDMRDKSTHVITLKNISSNIQAIAQTLRGLESRLHSIEVENRARSQVQTQSLLSQ